MEEDTIEVLTQEVFSILRIPCATDTVFAMKLEDLIQAAYARGHEAAKQDQRDF